MKTFHARLLYKRRSALLPVDSRLTAPTAVVDLVLGAGGSRGLGHIGFLKYIEQKRVAVGTVTGVSIGSLVGAFWCNGYRSLQIAQILRVELRRLPALRLLLQMLRAPMDPLRLAGGGHVDLVPFMRYLVRKYNLRPCEQLQIMAADSVTKGACLFSGTEYDLGFAIAASCSIPGVTRPVRYGKMLLVDGGMYNMTPIEFCKNPAIVASLDRVRRLPRHRVSLVGLISQIYEWTHPGRHSPLPSDIGNNYVVVDGPPDVGTATFRLSAREYRRIIDFGFRAAEKKLSALIGEGLIPTR